MPLPTMPNGCRAGCVPAGHAGPVLDRTAFLPGRLVVPARRWANMDVLVALGTSVAYFFSLAVVPSIATTCTSISKPRRASSRLGNKHQTKQTWIVEGAGGCIHFRMNECTRNDAFARSLEPEIRRCVKPQCSILDSVSWK